MRNSFKHGIYVTFNYIWHVFYDKEYRLTKHFQTKNYETLIKIILLAKWLESESKDIIQVDDPATGKVIGEISCAKMNVDLAVSAAKAAFKSRVLVDMPLLERAKLMHRIADETRKNNDEGGKRFFVMKMVKCLVQQ